MVRFGSTAVTKLPLTPLAQGPGNALVAGRPLGATNFPAALDACRTLLRSAANPVIFLLSDGTPDLGDGRPTAALFPAIARSVEALHGTPVHVLLTVPGGVNPTVEQAWQEAGAASVTDLGTGTGWRDRLVRRLVENLGSAIGVLPRPVGTLDAQHRSLQLPIPAYTVNLTVTAYAPGSAPALQLVDPSGKVSDSGTGAITFLRHEEPASGTWTIRLADGDGPVSVQADVTPVQARLLSPTTALPVGRPVEIVASVPGADREATEPLYVGAVVVTGGSAYELELSRHADGIWRSSKAAPARAAGELRIRLVVKAGPTTVVDSTSSSLRITDRPYLVLTDPVVNTSNRYHWRLYVGGKPVTDSGVLGEDPAAAVIVRVPAKEPVRAHYDGDGRWSIAADAVAGSRKVTAALSSRLVDGAVVTDELTSSVRVHPPTLTTRLLRAGLGLTGALALFTLTWACWLLWATRRPITGHLRGGASRMIRVRGKRWQRLTGADGGPIVVWAQAGLLLERRGLVPWPLDAVRSGFVEVTPAARAERARGRRGPTIRRAS